ncbi:MAG: hypothetical protein JWR80_8552 [Bradyrhizobium sp.]|nr:hypothetical protein [Bradyrhizobium sp.]
MNLAVYACACALGITTQSIGTMASRGGIERQNPVTILLGFLGMLATFSLFGWGFASFRWYVPILIFVGCSIVPAIVVQRGLITFWIVALPALETIVIALALWFWIGHWPF